MKTTHQILVDARALIAEPAHWTQRTYARDAKGNRVNEQSITAVCFCTAGALYRAAGPTQQLGPEVENAFKVMNQHARALTYGRHPVVSFNDHKTHAEVLQLFDHAIEVTKP